MNTLILLLKRIGKVLYTASMIVIVTAVIGVIYGLIVRGNFTLEYAFAANFIVAAVVIAAGLLYPIIPKRFIEKIKSAQLFEYKMHMEYMEERARKQEEGFHIMWIGISVALIAGFIEILIWLLR